MHTAKADFCPLNSAQEEKPIIVNLPKEQFRFVLCFCPAPTCPTSSGTIALQEEDLDKKVEMVA